MRRRDVGFGQGFAQQLHHARFVVDVRIRVHEHDRDRFGALLPDGGRDAMPGRIVQRLLHRAVVKRALRDFKTQMTRNERDVFAKVKIERVRPIDAPDFVDVAEPFGRDECSFGALAFEDRIDRDRRSVDDELGIACRVTRDRDGVEDAADQVVGRAQRFAERDGTIVDVHHGDIGKRPADIDSDAEMFALMQECSILAFDRTVQ